jgi:uncharacterized protein (DUF849 family)
MVSKYEKAILPHLAWLKEQITASSNVEINVKVKSLAKEMGEEFVSLTDILNITGLKKVKKM